jgi:AcrR family transcriptional regulator
VRLNVDDKDTRQDILQVALELFTERGYARTSLREIAERLGISKAAVYYHFRAKEELVSELTRPWLARLEELVDSGSDSEAEAVLAAYLRVFVAEQPVVGLLARNPTLLEQTGVGERAVELLDRLSHTIAGPAASDDDRLRAACAIGAINAVARERELTSDQLDVVLACAVSALNTPARAPA